MILRIGGMGMDEESIRQDRELARAAIKGLTSYAEQKLKKPLAKPER